MGHQHFRTRQGTRAHAALESRKSKKSKHRHALQFCNFSKGQNIAKPYRTKTKIAPKKLQHNTILTISKVKASPNRNNNNNNKIAPKMTANTSEIITTSPNLNTHKKKDGPKSAKSSE